MLKQALRSVGMMLKYARVPTVISLIGVLFEAVETPLRIFFTGRLVSVIAGFAARSALLNEVIMWGALLMASLLLSSAAGALRNMSSVYCLRALNKNFTSVIMDKFRSTEYACFEDKDVLDSIERMGNEPQQRIYHLFSRTVSALAMLIALAGTAVVFIQISVWFAVFYLVLLAPMLWLDYKWEEELQRLWNTEMPNWRRRTYLSALLADKHGVFELKLFGAVDYTLKRWKYFADTFRHEYVTTKIKSSKYGVLRDLMLAAWAVFVILTLLKKLTNGAVDLGLFTVCVASMGTILELSQTLSGMFSLVSQDCLIMRHFDIFMALPEMQNVVPENQATPENVNIRFENVCFTYPKTEETVLNNLSFEILPGERVALVGENGAGKSTIVKLLCGLYEPQSGEILINGTPINEFSAADRRAVFSVVFQDYMSFELTLRENVAFGDIKKLREDESIKEALRRGLWTEEMPLDTNLGKLEEDGVDLSGGQWQRLAVARSLLSDARFVILDEPTAALDPVAESRMYETFQSVLHGRGCVMISHRLASARLADKIVVIDGGEAAQIGSHIELMAAEGLYKTMYAAQASWYTEQGVEV